MYKKDAFKKLDAKYKTHLYTGLLGYAMRYSHRKLEKFIGKKKYSKVLEIGAGTAPHIDYLEHDYDEYFIVETSNHALEYYKKIKNIKAQSYDGVNLPFDDNFFDRIIISQCLEHVNEPEKFLFEMMSKLKEDGVLSISLPTDPGLLWRLGRLFIKFFIVKKTYNISKEEYEYINATEHVNSIFTLINLIRYNFKNQIEEYCLPFRIKILDVNLFYIVHITKFGS